jgi:hypothetical protein
MGRLFIKQKEPKSDLDLPLHLDTLIPSDPSLLDSNLDSDKTKDLVG